MIAGVEVIGGHSADNALFALAKVSLRDVVGAIVFLGDASCPDILLGAGDGASVVKERMLNLLAAWMF